MPRTKIPQLELPVRQKVSHFRRVLQTAGPPVAIGLCVLAFSVLAAGTLAAVVMGDELADTATDLIGDAGWFANEAGAWLGSVFGA
ncbi:MAG: hypothetical protein AAF916_01700 [Planctomycetota bacterium]